MQRAEKARLRQEQEEALSLTSATTTPSMKTTAATESSSKESNNESVIDRRSRDSNDVEPMDENSTEDSESKLVAAGDLSLGECSKLGEQLGASVEEKRAEAYMKTSSSTTKAALSTSATATTTSTSENNSESFNQFLFWRDPPLPLDDVKESPDSEGEESDTEGAEKKKTEEATKGEWMDSLSLRNSSVLVSLYSLRIHAQFPFVLPAHLHLVQIRTYTRAGAGEGRDRLGDAAADGDDRTVGDGVEDEKEKDDDDDDDDDGWNKLPIITFQTFDDLTSGTSSLTLTERTNLSPSLLRLLTELPLLNPRRVGRCRTFQLPTLWTDEDCFLCFSRGCWSLLGWLVSTSFEPGILYFTLLKLDQFL